MDDDRWQGLSGGYRVPFDPRPLLKRLETRDGVEDAWQELWNELHHQGDVGEASYATVPHLVRIYAHHSEPDWNMFALAALIEIQRLNGNNPPLPAWLESDYIAAIQQLATLAIQQLSRVQTADTARSMLAIIAVSKGLITHAAAILKFSPYELQELLPM